MRRDGGRYGIGDAGNIVGNMEAEFTLNFQQRMKVWRSIQGNSWFRNQH